MNVIDALVVTLGLDATQFSAEQKKAVDTLKTFSEESDKRTKQVQDQGKKTASVFSGLKIEILGALAAFGATVGIKDFLQSNVEGQASLGRLSTNLNISARSLEAWGLVAKEQGGKAEDAFGAFQSVAKGLAEASISGHSGLTDTARANGIDLSEAVKNGGDYEAGIKAIFKRLRELPRQQASYEADQLGVGALFNAGMMPDLDAQLAHAYGLARVTQEGTRGAQELQKEWVDLQQRFTGASETIFTKLEPALIRVGNQFANWLDKINWQPMVDGIGKVANWIATINWDNVLAYITRLVSKIDGVVKSMGGWKTIAEVLIGLVGIRLAASILGPIASITRLLPWLTAGSAGFTAMGACATAAGAAIFALVAASALHIDSLGGRLRPDGTYEDETSATKKPDGLANADLWDTIHGKPSAYHGKPEQAAALLAQRMSGDDKVSDEIIGARVADIMGGRVRQGDIYGDKDKSQPLGAAGPPAGGYQSSLDKGSDGDWLGKYNSQHSRLYKTNEELFKKIEERAGLPAGVMAGIFKAESGNGKYLLSPKGAKGPMGFMDATAAEYGLDQGSEMDLDASAMASATKMSRLMKMFNGNIDMALVAYNWGEGNLKKYGIAKAPAESRAYLKAITGHDLWGSSTLAAAKNQTKNVAIGPGASVPAAARNIALGPSATAPITSSRQAASSVDRSVEVNIQTIQVNAPKATDAQGISKNINSALKSNVLIAGAVTGIE